MEIILLSIVILSLGLLGMAFNIVFRKKSFPDTHVGSNKEMRKRKIVCAKTMDRMEQAKAKKNIEYSNLKIYLE